MYINDTTKDALSYYLKIKKNLTPENNEELNKNIISKKWCIELLEGLMLFCEGMSQTINNFEINDKRLYDATKKIYDSIPKSPDYEPGFDASVIPDFSSMNDEDLSKYLSELLDAYFMYRLIQKEQSYTSRAKRILQSIESIKKQSIELGEKEQNKLKDIYDKIQEKINFNCFVDIKELDDEINKFEDVAHTIWNNCLDSGKYYLVHNFSKGYREDFVPSEYLSTSLVTDKYMALFGNETNNNYGIIVRPKKIISADIRDSLTHNRNEEVDIDLFLFGVIPPLLFPWEIEKEAIKDAFESNGEILNYKNGRNLPEILINGYEVVAVYYRKSKDDCSIENYNMAIKLSEKYNVKVVELNKDLGCISEISKTKNR